MKYAYQVLVSTVLLALLASPSFALGIAWQDLNKYEKKVLVDLQDQWDTLEPARQTELQQVAERWLNRSIRRHGFDIEQYENWRQMPDGERKRLRNRFQKFQSLSEAEQEQIRSTRQRFQKLDPKERENWRKRWEAMSPEERAAHQEQRAQRRAAH